MLFSGYAILEGFDFGAGAWHLFFRKDLSRRIAINAIGPIWDVNQVWLVIGGGALFAGFPVMYATMPSAMYIPFMLFLMFNVLRAAAIKFRSAEEMKWWRTAWDITYSVSCIIIAFLLGVVLRKYIAGFRLGTRFHLPRRHLFLVSKSLRHNGRADHAFPFYDPGSHFPAVENRRPIARPTRPFCFKKG